MANKCYCLTTRLRRLCTVLPEAAPCSPSAGSGSDPENPERGCDSQNLLEVLPGGSGSVQLVDLPGTRLVPAQSGSPVLGFVSLEPKTHLKPLGFVTSEVYYY